MPLEQADFPTGIVTFLFTDLEGSTRLWETHPNAMQTALARHDELLRNSVHEHGGNLVKTTGDGLHAAFFSPSDAATAAISAQSALFTENWEDTGQLKVRMGIHTGEAHFREGDYFGPTLNRAARLMSIGHGGQILLSQASASILQDQLPSETSLFDLGSHHLRDLSEPEQVYQLNHTPLPTDFPPIRSQFLVPNNLSAQLTSFIGRKKQIAEIEELLEQSRLLTLVGTGGTGKTRLMLEVAERSLARYPEGIWMVELAPLSDPDQIIPAIAKIFSIKEFPGRPLKEVIAAYLRTKEAVLLLDNCEHVIAASAELAEYLLQNCPQLKVVATSREGLAIPGEVIYQVPSMSLPKMDEKIDAEDLLNTEAVQLFAARAAGVNPTFELTKENVAVIAQICRRLDGIPLAIELAASRAAMLSVDQISERLNDRFRLLSGGSRTALPRQQTLEALIDWSWNLLSEEEQDLLQRLSVFAGGWRLSAAEAIAKQGSGGYVFDTLTQLVKKSLVAVDNFQANAVRYRLLESVRQYAYDKLLSSGEADELRNQHSTYYIDLVLQSEPHMKGEDMLIWIKRLKKEEENLRAAVEWSLENDSEMAIQYAGATFIFNGQTISHRESEEWIRRAIQQGEEKQKEDQDLERELRISRAYTMLAWIVTIQGNFSEGTEISDKALKLARSFEDDDLLSFALTIRAVTSAYTAGKEEAFKMINEAISFNRNKENLYFLAFSIMVFFNYSMYHKEEPGEDNLIKEYEKITKKLNNPWVTAFYLLTSAMLGESDEAEAKIEQVISIYMQIGDRHFANMARSDLGHIFREDGENDKAAEVYTEAIVVWLQHGHISAVAHQLECFAFLAAIDEEYTRAAHLLGAAEAIRTTNDMPRVRQEQDEFEQAQKQIRKGLGAEAGDKALAEGAALSIDVAVGVAISDYSPS